MQLWQDDNRARVDESDDQAAALLVIVVFWLVVIGAILTLRGIL